jgi:hypothetical protein
MGMSQERCREVGLFCNGFVVGAGLTYGIRLLIGGSDVLSLPFTVTVLGGIVGMTILAIVMWLKDIHMTESLIDALQTQ